MNSIDYIGFDIHKKTISFCAKAQDGRILDEGTIPARRTDLSAWAKRRSRPWWGAMEATLFTGWVYDHLKPLAQELKVAHPAMLKAITASKKKNDKVDARKRRTRKRRRIRRVQGIRCGKYVVDEIEEVLLARRHVERELHAVHLPRRVNGGAPD